MERSREQGAEGVVLGCTELPVLIAPSESPLPVFDTMGLHAIAAVDSALTDRDGFAHQST